jgi:hypothetical protein
MVLLLSIRADPKTAPCLAIDEREYASPDEAYKVRQDNPDEDAGRQVPGIHPPVLQSRYLSLRPTRLSCPDTHSANAALAKRSGISSKSLAPPFGGGRGEVEFDSPQYPGPK